MSLFARASIHQGHECFSVQSRGKQCSFMSLSALLAAQSIPVFEWNSAIIDSILVQGDNMYLHSYNNNLIPREGLLSLNNLPTVIDTNGLPIYAKLPSVMVTNGSDLPIVVEPIEAQNKSDLPIVVEPIEAQNKSDLPTVIEPIEAQNENQRWFINYGKDHQGLIRSDYELGTPYFNIHSALMNTFTCDNYGILILESFMIALIKGLDSTFYLFDSHARNNNGMPDSNGTAVVMKFYNLSELQHHLSSLSNELNTNLFEVVPVQLKQVYNAKKHMRQKRAHETECEKHARREKARKYKKRKRDAETETEKQTRLENTRNYKRRKQAEKACVDNEISMTNAVITVNQQDYLKEHHLAKNGSIEEQSWAKANIKKFHKSVQFSVSRCKICQEAWPLKSKPRSPNDYVCSRCCRDKKSPKKFSCENSMIPSPVPHQLQNLTQIEEMLIARALPIMRVYIKPGGQRSYSGHCINSPQNVTELATSLPRYPKDLAVIIVKVKGRDNTFKDVTVRKQKVHNALVWL